MALLGNTSFFFYQMSVMVKRIAERLKNGGEMEHGLAQKGDH